MQMIFSSTTYEHTRTGGARHRGTHMHAHSLRAWPRQVRTAATGRQLKQSVKVFQSLIE